MFELAYLVVSYLFTSEFFSSSATLSLLEMVELLISMAKACSLFGALSFSSDQSFNTLAVSSWWCFAAKSAGVSPNLSFADESAPAPRSAFTTVVWPFFAER